MLGGIEESQKTFYGRGGERKATELGRGRRPMSFVSSENISFICKYKESNCWLLSVGTTSKRLYMALENFRIKKKRTLYDTETENSIDKSLFLFARKLKETTDKLSQRLSLNQTIYKRTPRPSRTSLIHHTNTHTHCSVIIFSRPDPLCMILAAFSIMKLLLCFPSAPVVKAPPIFQNTSLSVPTF